MQSHILHFSRRLLLLRQLLTGNQLKDPTTAAKIMSAETSCEGNAKAFLKERSKREGALRTKAHPT